MVEVLVGCVHERLIERDSTGHRLGCAGRKMVDVGEKSRYNLARGYGAPLLRLSAALKTKRRSCFRTSTTRDTA